MELIIDARYDNMHVLTDHGRLRRWLLRLCKFIGMTPLEYPIIRDYPWPGGKVNAPSACLFLKESSIVVHVYPEYQYVYINVFSCKWFDIGAAQRFIKKTLKTEGERSIVLNRGIDMETGVPLKLEYGR